MEQKQQKQSFLKHFTIIGGGTVINMLLGLLTEPIITRLVDPSDNGKYGIFNMYSSLAVMVLCIGLDQALVRYYYEKDTDDYKRSLLSKCIVIPVLLCLAVSGIVMALSISGLVKFKFDPLIMGILCIFTLFQLIYRFSLLLVRLEYKSKLYSLLNIIHKLMYLAAVFPLIFLFKHNHVMALVISTTIASFVCLFTSITANRRLWKPHTDKSACETPRKELMRFGYPYILSMGLATLFSAIDKISLDIYRTDHEIGVYTSAITLINVFAIIQTTFNTLWQPMSVEHYTKDPEDKSFYQQGNQLITIVMFFIGLSLILFKDLFVYILGAKYREAATILPFLCFNPIMYTISETTVSGLVFKKKSMMQIVVSAGACATNIIGNMILVPRLGGKGAAISTGISYIVFFTLRTVLSNRYFYVDFKLGRFYTLTFAVVLYCFYNTFFKFGILTIVGYIACVALLVVLYFGSVKWGLSYLSKGLKKILHKK
ncbi:MAG: oligosaccharide flippase family protein [Ruminococcus sp.]|nr:oligosaccharide flippase family protein [Ruminococcus sp.]